MSTDLIDSNLIIYVTQPNHENIRQYIADTAPAVAVTSKIETLGYHKLSSECQKFLEEFYDAAISWRLASRLLNMQFRSAKNVVSFWVIPSLQELLLVMGYDWLRITQQTLTGLAN